MHWPNQNRFSSAVFPCWAQCHSYKRIHFLPEFQDIEIENEEQSDDESVGLDELLDHITGSWEIIEEPVEREIQIEIGTIKAAASRLLSNNDKEGNGKTKCTIDPKCTNSFLRNVLFQD